MDSVMGEVPGGGEHGKRIPPPHPPATHTHRLSQPTGPQIRVGLRQAENLKAKGTADPYARVSVSSQPGRRHETKVHRGTLCPLFEETCCFLVSLTWVRRVGWGQSSRTQLTALPAGPPSRAVRGYPKGATVGLQAVLRTRAAGGAPTITGYCRPSACPGELVPAGRSRYH